MPRLQRTHLATVTQMAPETNTNRSFRFASRGNSNETQSSADKSSRIVKANKFDVKENGALDGREAEENGSNLVSW
jgi:hypothetical protein